MPDAYDLEEHWKTKYDTVKFEIRYIVFFAAPEQISGFMEMIRRGELSKYTVQAIADHNSIVPDRWREIAPGAEGGKICTKN